MRYRVYYEVYSSYVRQMANGYREMTFSLRLTTESEEEARAEAERIKVEEGCDAWYERATRAAPDGPSSWEGGMP